MWWHDRPGRDVAPRGGQLSKLRARKLVFEEAVNFPSMPDFDNQEQRFLLIQLVNDTPIA